MLRECELVRCPRKVTFVIGFEEEVSSRDEDLGKGTKKLRVDESAAMVSGLGPRVREQEVESAGGGVRKKPLYGVACLESQYP